MSIFPKNSCLQTTWQCAEFGTAFKITINHFPSNNN